MGVPVAYLRRSRVDAARPGAISYEQQLQAVRKLALDHGDDPDRLVVLEDWGKSGRAEKQRARGAFARLEAMIEADETTAVYSYSISRLARSIEVLSRLARLCEQRQVPIRCAFGHSPDVSSATGRLITSILAAVEQWQAEWNAERMAEATAVRRTRGDYIGPAPYGQRVVRGQLVPRPEEDPAVVIAAYREAGTAHGAARLLNERGVPTRAGRPWKATSLRGIVERNAPDELSPGRTPGRPATVVARFAGLLRCPCGATLTARHFASGRFTYECRRNYDNPHHQTRQVTVTEVRILDWAMAEADRLAVPDRVVVGDIEDAPMRDELEGRRRRVVDNYEDGLIDRVERDAKLLNIAKQLERLAAIENVVDVPRLDWAWPPAQVNLVLRAIWDHVDLDADLRPMRAEWTIPEWRS
jgi:DNA invertase Pin-like site-specific DNA recombinase